MKSKGAGRKKDKKDKSFRNILAAVEAAAVAAFFLSIAAPIVWLTEWKGSLFLLAFSVFLPAVGCRFLMEKVRSFWIYSLGWALLALFCAGAAFWIGGVFCGIAAGCSCFALLLQRMIPNLQGVLQPGWFRLGIMAALFFISFTVTADAANLVLYCLMAYILLKLLWGALSSTDSYIAGMEDVSFLPGRQIRAMGGGIAFLYVGLAALVMAGCLLLPLNGIIEQIGTAIASVFRWLFSLFPSGGESEIPPSTPMAPEGGEIGFFEEAGDPSWLAQALQAIFAVLGIGLAITGAVAGIGYLIYKLYKHFYEIPEGRIEEREFLLPMMKEERLARKGRAEKSASGRDPSSRIRRIYRKKLKGKLGKREKFPESSAPREQLAIAKLEHEEGIEFCSLYEKARYSGSATQEEAERMRSIASKL